MLLNALRSLLNEPKVANPPCRTWRDWALVGLLVPLAIVEVIVDDVVWPPVALALGVSLLFILPWRRAYPFAVVAIGFGAHAVADVVTLFAADDSMTLTSSVFGGLITTYGLFRWASGRHAAIGLMIVVITNLLTDANTGDVAVIEAIVGNVFWLFPAALGTTMRYRAGAQLRAVNEARLREREQLARELHDSVAHHVSAIVIQAQAGRAVAASDPAVASEVLAVIERAASNALIEMRTMVGALRDDDDAEMSPGRRLTDIEALTASPAGGPKVEVRLQGSLDNLAPSVESAIYRMAQESITNARRHARHATRVFVQIAGGPDTVRLTVEDNGDAAGITSASGDGYGLVGMSERAKLLGGTFEAGPGPTRGWTITAVLPRARSAQ